jgi:CRP/FNR family cyclic AMP-dependent transcriptional regulator
VLHSAVTQTPDDILARLADNEWFRGQPPEQAQALLRAGQVRRLAAGEWAYGEGDEETGLLAVIEGGLRLYAQAPGGREALVGAMQPGAVMGQSALFGGGPRLVSAICASDSLLFSLSDRALRRVAAEHPAVWRDLSSLIYRQLQLAIQVLAERAALSPRGQLAARLLLMSREEPVIHIGQGEMAEMIGVSRKTLNGWLAGFARAGIVRTGYGRIEVLDRRRLALAQEAQDVRSALT